MHIQQIRQFLDTFFLYILGKKMADRISAWKCDARREMAQ